MKYTCITFLLFIISLGMSVNVYSQEPFRCIVATDGTGTHTSIQAAIDACPDNERSLIFVKNGLYEERVSIGSKDVESSKMISLIGESAEGVVISSNGHRADNGLTFYDIVTFQVYAKDFYAENLTIQNTAGNVGQAEALFTGNDKQTFKNCRILGFQDTFRSKKGTRSYFKDCWIEGAVDFIYAGGIIFFDDCSIHHVRGGYVAAPEDCFASIPKSKTACGKVLKLGFIFRNCDLTANDDVKDQCYLGRPWSENSGIFYLNCKLGSHITAKGWQEWGGNETTACFAEYNSMDAEGNLLDVSQRASWSFQLPKEDAENLLTPEYVYDRAKANDPYDPVSLCVAPQEPGFLTVSNKALTWGTVNGAVGYIVLKGDKLIAITTKTTYTDETDGEGKYSVKTIDEMGRLSTARLEGTVSSMEDMAVSQWNVKVDGKNISWNGNAKAELFTLNGVCIAFSSFQDSFVVEANNGIYILKLTDEQNDSYFQKIVIK